MPVLAIVTKDGLYDKMISQVQQAKARGGVVIALATEGDELIRSEADTVIYAPPRRRYWHPSSTLCRSSY